MLEWKLHYFEMIWLTASKYSVYKCFFSSLSNLKNLLPSRCDLGESFCQATCNSIGRTGGKCIEDGNNCECDDTYLSPSEFALCAAESTCRLDCQRQG